MGLYFFWYKKCSLTSTTVIFRNNKGLLRDWKRFPKKSNLIFLSFLHSFFYLNFFIPFWMHFRRRVIMKVDFCQFIFRQSIFRQTFFRQSNFREFYFRHEHFFDNPIVDRHFFDTSTFFDTNTFSSVKFSTILFSTQTFFRQSYFFDS